MDKVKLRRKIKRKKPRFHMQEETRHHFLIGKWRKPRGLRNKMRLGKKGKPRVPNTGWRSPCEVRGFHPSGKPEVLIFNLAELEGKKDVLIRISKKVGNKKRLAIMNRANELKLKVINQRKIVERKKKVKESGKAKQDSKSKA